MAEAAPGDELSPRVRWAARWGGGLETRLLLGGPRGTAGPGAAWIAAVGDLLAPEVVVRVNGRERSATHPYRLWLAVGWSLGLGPAGDSAVP